MYGSFRGIWRRTFWALTAAALVLTSIDASAARRSWFSWWWGSSVSTPAPAPVEILNLAGAPATSVTVGERYYFRPTVTGSHSRRLSYSIRNKPSWASFSISSGRLSGRPGSGDVGSYANVSIGVSDGRKHAWIPAFAIAVAGIDSQPEPEPHPVNHAPTISGAADGEIMVGESYLFKPVASDSDGDKLTFSIANRPAWASFDAGAGTLSGTPGAAYAGNYDGVRISVSDGRGGSSTLPAFGIAVMQSSNGVVTVSWTPPVRNTDGSALTNLAGYRIHYGRQPGGPYATTINASNPAVSTCMVENLTAGTYYFVVTANNGAGVESELSNEATKTLY